MGAAKPLDPFRDFCTRIFLGREVVLKRHSHGFVNLASSFNYTLVALDVKLRLDSVTLKIDSQR